MAGKLAFACAALLLPLAAFAQDPEPVTPAQEDATEYSGLGWLTGDWQTGNLVDGQTVEHWEPMRGNTKLGLGQLVKGRVSLGFEYMRIVRHAEGLVFYGSASGTEEVAFAQASLIERPAEGRYEVVFVNPGHDYPKRISYRLAGETGNILVSTISGANPRADSMTWQYHRVAARE